MSAIELAITSIVASDQRMAAEFGGQKFTHIARVEHNKDDKGNHFMVITGKNGKTSSCKMNPALVSHPDQRSLLPGDVHDAVLSAIIAGSDAVKDGAS